MGSCPSAEGRSMMRLELRSSVVRLVSRLSSPGTPASWFPRRVRPRSWRKVPRVPGREATRFPVRSRLLRLPDTWDRASGKVAS